MASTDNPVAYQSDDSDDAPDFDPDEPLPESESSVRDFDNLDEKMEETKQEIEKYIRRIQKFIDDLCEELNFEKSKLPSDIPKSGDTGELQDLRKQNEELKRIINKNNSRLDGIRKNLLNLKDCKGDLLDFESTEELPQEVAERTSSSSSDSSASSASSASSSSSKGSQGTGNIVPLELQSAFTNIAQQAADVGARKGDSLTPRGGNKRRKTKKRKTKRKKLKKKRSTKK